MAKLMRANRNFGRCRVEGHGDRCEVSKDIQSVFIPRSSDVRRHIQEELDLSECDPLVPYCTSCHQDAMKLIFTHSCVYCGCNECVDCANMSKCYCM